MPISSHSHSGQFCKHAFSTLEEVILRAIDVGFEHYGLSEHMPRFLLEDLYEEETADHLTPSDLQIMFTCFVKEARGLQEKYKTKISLTVGMETDVIREESFEAIQRLKREFELDYLVGSVHHVDGIPIDCGLEQFEKAEELVGGTEEVMCRYFDHQFRLLEEVSPEVIGHFDLIRAHRPEFEFSDMIWEKIVRNINFGISYGALFEINTSGASPNKKLQFPYPHRNVLEHMLKSGAKLTLSDDSHGIGDVGFWYDCLPQFLKDNNVSELYYLHRELVPSDSRELQFESKVVCKKLIDWSSHPFWENCTDILKEF
ncbi:uncharacterized protein [Montipora foliosa]|uniref:uncharacterized protein n=1 Tax=Montipora foliosa TaxID=591990 RepID=UPI0035F14C37